MLFLSNRGLSILIKRRKGSDSGEHPLQPDEVAALEELKRIYPGSRFLFPSGRSPKHCMLENQQYIELDKNWRQNIDS